MAITRSRNTGAPKSTTVRGSRRLGKTSDKEITSASSNSSTSDASGSKLGKGHVVVTTSKTSLRNRGKTNADQRLRNVSKSTATKNGIKKTIKKEEKSAKEVTVKDTTKNINNEKDKPTQNPVAKEKKIASPAEKVDYPIYTEGEMKGRRMPAYKIEQLQRLQRLIDLSSAAKPKGPITSSDKPSDFQTASKILKLRIADDNKKKISSATNYDPIRAQFIEGSLDGETLKLVQTRYEKVRKFKDVSTPKLKADECLQVALQEVASETSELEFWKPAKITRKIMEAKVGNQQILENELKLNRLALQEDSRENLLEQKLNHTIDLHDRTFDVAGVKDNAEVNVAGDYSEEEVGKDSTPYAKIDVSKAASNTDLEKMLKTVEHGDNLNGEFDGGDVSLFDGLKVEDYTIRRNFKNSRA